MDLCLTVVVATVVGFLMVLLRRKNAGALLNSFLGNPWIRDSLMALLAGPLFGSLYKSPALMGLIESTSAVLWLAVRGFSSKLLRVGPT